MQNDMELIPTVTLISSVYTVAQGNCRINVEVNKDNKLTILNERGSQEFIFQKSDPRVVEKIAQLLIVAYSLTQNRSKDGKETVQ